MGRLTDDIRFSVFHPPDELMLTPSQDSLQHFQLTGLEEVGLKGFDQMGFVQLEEDGRLDDGTELFTQKM